MVEEVHVFRRVSEREWTVSTLYSGESFSLQSLPSGTLEVLVSEVYGNTNAFPSILESTWNSPIYTDEEAEEIDY